MKTQGILYTQPNGQQEIIISCANHHFNSSSDGKVSADGGQQGYNRTVYDKDAIFQWIWFEYKNVTHADLYNDWNNQVNELGRVWYPTEKVTILEEKDYPDTDSFEWKVETVIWGTNGPLGDQPTIYKHLTDCDTDHLETILTTQRHISGETRRIIEHILKTRE